MSLKGKRIAICASRKALDITEKIINLGGRPFVEDIVRIEYVPEEEVRDALIESLSLKPHFFLFTTGEGTERVFQVAQKYGLFEPLRENMLKGTILARGYKTRKVLLKYGFEGVRTVESSGECIGFLKEEEVIEYLYDLYEVFNFEITFLANIPEELWREVERLDIPNSINSKMEEIANLLEDILQYERESPKLYAMLTPFRAFLEVIRQALSFNKRLFESNLQRTV